MSPLPKKSYRTLPEKTETILRCVEDSYSHHIGEVNDWVVSGKLYLLNRVVIDISDFSKYAFFIRTPDRKPVTPNDKYQSFSSDRFVIYAQYNLN